MSKPTFAELQQLVIKALKDNHSPLTDYTQGSFSYTYARALATVNQEHYNRVLQIVDSSNIATATGADLDVIGEYLNLPRQKGERATGNVLMATISSTSFVLSPNTLLTHLETGNQYLTKNLVDEIITNVTEKVIPVEAINAGVSYNLGAGTELVILNNEDIEIYVGSSRNSLGEVCGSIEGATDSETDYAYRQRIAKAISETGGSTTNFILSKAISYNPTSRFYVKTEVGGFVEVWLDNPTTLTALQIENLRTYLQNYIPVGILLLVKQLNRVYVDLTIHISPFLPANYSQLTEQITALCTTYINSIPPGNSFVRREVFNLITPLVNSVVITSPEELVSCLPWEKIVLRKLDIKYATR